MFSLLCVVNFPLVTPLHRESFHIQYTVHIETSAKCVHAFYCTVPLNEIHVRLRMYCTPNLSTFLSSFKLQEIVCYIFHISQFGAMLLLMYRMYSMYY
jgi:hypothetical protein